MTKENVLDSIATYLHLHFFLYECTNLELGKRYFKLLFETKHSRIDQVKFVEDSLLKFYLVHS